MPANLPTEPLSSEEFRKAVSRLSVALELIESTCGPAIAMLDACLKVVALVRIPGPAAAAAVDFRAALAGDGGTDESRFGGMGH